MGCLLLGAAVGLGSVGVHRAAFPAGLVLVLGTTYAAAWWLRGRDPWFVVAFAVGWLSVLAVAVIGRPEGDYVVAADVPGYGLLVGGLGLLVVCVVSLPVRRGSLT